jgi:hypothetical protein
MLTENRKSDKTAEPGGNLSVGTICFGPHALGMKAQAEILTQSGQVSASVAESKYYNPVVGVARV